MKTLPDRLREALWCPEATDEQVLKMSEGTLFRALIELKMAMKDLGREFRKAFKPTEKNDE